MTTETVNARHAAALRAQAKAIVPTFADWQAAILAGDTAPMRAAESRARALRSAARMHQSVRVKFLTSRGIAAKIR
jgi:hypothetical protein